MTERDWELIMQFHLNGTYSVSKAAWGIMRNKQYGRIINTTSASGLYGSFGQTNYSAAKMGILGFSNSLAKEGESKNIKVNSIAPIAGTRMTETTLPKELTDAMEADAVAPLVMFLAHEDCPDNGSLFEVCAGYHGKLRWERTEGVTFSLKDTTVENIAKNWDQITDFSKSEYPEDTAEIMVHIKDNIEFVIQRNKLRANKTDAADPSLRSTEIFAMMEQYLSDGHGASLIPKVNAKFGFAILKKKGDKKPAGTWLINLKDGQGSVTYGPVKQSDAFFTMVDGDFDGICSGKENPQMMFIQGKMKIKGNMSKAQKFTPELFPPPTPENMLKYGTKSPKL